MFGRAACTSGWLSGRGGRYLVTNQQPYLVRLEPAWAHINLPTPWGTETRIWTPRPTRRIRQMKTKTTVQLLRNALNNSNIFFCILRQWQNLFQSLGMSMDSDYLDLTKTNRQYHAQLAVCLTGDTREVCHVSEWQIVGKWRERGLSATYGAAACWAGGGRWRHHCHPPLHYHHHHHHRHHYQHHHHHHHHPYEWPLTI